MVVRNVIYNMQLDIEDCTESVKDAKERHATGIGKDCRQHHIHHEKAKAGLDTVCEWTQRASHTN